MSATNSNDALLRSIEQDANSKLQLIIIGCKINYWWATAG